LAIATISRTSLGLRGQDESFFAHSAMLSMLQPHSHLCSFSTCRAAAFWASLIPSKLTPLTEVRSDDFIHFCGN
jgi:hypothetical protein